MNRDLPRGVPASLAAALLFGAGTPFAKLLLEQASPLLLAVPLYLGLVEGGWLAGERAACRQWLDSLAQLDLSGRNVWDRADIALRQAAVIASTDADRMALRLLVNHFEDLRRWSAGLIDANRNLRLAEYYISETALENDPMFQKTSACGDFLASMLASGRFVESASCQ